MFITKCRVCKVGKSRAWSGKYAGITAIRPGGYRIYVDQDQQRWSGLACPACAKDAKRISNEKCRSMDYTSKREYLFSEDCIPEPTDPMTKRKCRGCNKFLPASRYFRHKECWEKIEGGASGSISRIEFDYGVSK